MLKFFLTCICILLQSSPIITSETEISSNNTLFSIATTDPPLPTSVEKLVRFRRQPPYTIIKHIIRTSKHSKPRRRIKRPRIKYVQPYYSFAEPTIFYKPRPTFEYAEPPIYTSKDSHHLKIDATDYKLPPFSYESHTMDLDFYSHASESPHDNAFDLEQKGPTYSLATSKPDYSEPRVPHLTYGAPYKYISSYSSDTNYNSGGSEYKISHASSSDSDSHSYISSENSYTPPESNAHEPAISETPTSKKQYHQFYSKATPEFIEYKPSSDTHLSNTYSPTNKENQHPSVTSSDSYPLYDKKIYNTGYSSNFGEPPSANKDIEITYSPSYEINLPSANQEKTEIESYPKSHPAEQPPKYQEIENYAKPPAGPPPKYQEIESYDKSHPVEQPPKYQDIESYAKPPAEQPSNYQEQDLRKKPVVPEEYPASAPEDHLPISEELPLSPTHKQPGYNYPKSSYEVPIYDPIPFEASNYHEQEYYPPHMIEKPADNSLRDKHVSYTKTNRNENNVSKQYQPKRETLATENSSRTLTSSTNEQTPPRIRRTRKRKRVRGNTQTNTTTKHILDVPELKKAFEAENRKRNHADAVVNESNFVEKKKTYENYITSTTATPVNFNENYVSHSWNPTRLRTSVRDFYTPTSTPISIEKSASTSERKTKIRTEIGTRSRPLTTTTTIPATTKNRTRNIDSNKVAILSIEKSRSQSYYDGTIAPPTLTISNLYKSRLNRFRMPTRTPTTVIHGKESSSSSSLQATTRSVFDTTYFNVPRRTEVNPDRQNFSPRNIPKNHKLF